MSARVARERSAAAATAPSTFTFALTANITHRSRIRELRSERLNEGRKVTCSSHASMK